MATTVYPRYASTNAIPAVNKSASGQAYANYDGNQANWGHNWLSTSRGTAASGGYPLGNSVTGPTNGVAMSANTVQDTYPGGDLYVSAPLAADVTISGSITANIWAYEANMASNAAINFAVFKHSRLDQSLTRICKSARVTELGTADAVNNFTATPTSTTFNRGDRIVIQLFADDAGTMATGGYIYTNINGPTAGVTGDTYFTFTETFTFDSSTPSGTTIYPTGSSAGINPGAATELKAGTSRGVGSQTASVTTAAGPTAPRQLQYAGANVEWYTPPIEAMTLSGPVLVNARAWEPNSSANSSIRCEIAVTAGDGTAASVWGMGGGGSTSVSAASCELYTTEESIQFLVAGDDTSISAGQRIRIRFFSDDAYGSTLAMAAGYSTSLAYGGSSGASGDTYLTFSQSVVFTAETVTPTPFSLNAIVTNAWGWTGTPADEAAMGSQPTFTFLTPNPGVYPARFQIQLDTASTFDTANLLTYGPLDGLWEYWNGSSWVTFGMDGIPLAYRGNQARFTVPVGLSETTWYRRIRHMLTGA